MAMPELAKEQKAALVVSRIARTVAHHEAARRIVTHDMSKCRASLLKHGEIKDAITRPRHSHEIEIYHTLMPRT